MKKTLATVLFVLPSLALAGNFATCLLDELPSTQNDNAAYQVCSDKYPARYDGVAQGSGRGVFSYDSGGRVRPGQGPRTPGATTPQA